MQRKDHFLKNVRWGKKEKILTMTLAVIKQHLNEYRSQGPYSNILLHDHVFS